MNVSTKLDAIGNYLNRGWHIHPVKPNKEPWTPNGFHDATTDRDRLFNYWTRQPDALIGISTGPSNLLVIDIDKLEALGELEERGYQLPDTYSTITPRGGLHYYYQKPPVPLPKKQGAGCIPIGGQIEKIDGIDFRCDAGYVVAPPGGNYLAGHNWQTPDPTPAPEWMTRPPAPRAGPPTPAHRPTPAPDTGDTRYGLRALDGILASLAVATEGHRNEQLNIEALNVGRLVAGGQLDPTRALTQLKTVAQRIGLDDSEINKTIESGFTAGLTQPRRPK